MFSQILPYLGVFTLDFTLILSQKGTVQDVLVAGQDKQIDLEFITSCRLQRVNSILPVWLYGETQAAEKGGHGIDKKYEVFIKKL